MKNTLSVIAGLLTIIWAIVYFEFNSFGVVHVILVVAVFIFLVRIIFSKKLSDKL
jgi:tryptophan-rich sensory protein